MASRTDLAQSYLASSMAGDVDAVLLIVTDDVVLDRPMLGPVTGKDALADAIRNRPPGIGSLTPTFEPPSETGEQVAVKGNLPPGSPFPISSLTWTFSFRDDLISRVAVGL